MHHKAVNLFVWEIIIFPSAGYANKNTAADKTGYKWKTAVGKTAIHDGFLYYTLVYITSNKIAVG
jgi:hypothetical protein